LIFADVQGAEARLILGGQQTLRRTRYFYCEFYNVEQYERQPDIKGLLSFLPDFDLIGIYGDNALFANRELA
jgi:2-O-methyltransferase